MIEPESVEQITKITDHVSSATERMTQKYASKRLLAELGGAFFKALQRVEDAYWDMLTDSIDTAEGKRLDRIGQIVGLKRGDLEEEPYRMILRAWILANRSNGTGEDILAVMAAMLGDYGLFTTDETGRLSMLVEPKVPTPHYVAMSRVLQRAKMGAARVQMTYFTEVRGAFKFAKSRLLPEEEPGHGLGDVNDPDVGGVLVGVIE